MYSLSGKAERSGSERIELLVLSIIQDLGRAATKGQWSLPKNILLCMTSGHLFWSVKLSVLMNKLGHSESYSFSLELETALGETLEDAHNILTPRAGLKRELMGLQPQAHPKIGSSLYQVNEVIKVTDKITFKK